MDSLKVFFMKRLCWLQGFQLLFTNFKEVEFSLKSLVFWSFYQKKKKKNPGKSLKYKDIYVHVTYKLILNTKCPLS